MHYLINSLRPVVVWMVLLVCVCCIGSCKKGPEQAARVESKEAASMDADAGLKVLPVTLPKPQFIGTPTNIRGVTNIEQPLGRARPPFLAPAGVTNVALNKPVKGSVGEPIMGSFAMITNGDKEATDGSLVELDPFTQYVTIDLGQIHAIHAILFWHYHKQSRVYFDVVVQVSDDPDFITDVKTLFNNDQDNSSGLGAGEDKHYVETAEGKLLDAKGVQGRFVRLYSRGNSSNDQNHYLEVEVYGKPVP